MNIINKLLRKDQSKKVALYQYKNESGEFDYEKYKEIQTKGNKGKIEKTWVTEDEIKYLSLELKKLLPNVKSGICHGTRRGLEQKWFSENLNCPVIGTEISDSASQFENTIQWDFHEVKEDWIGKFDFVYSNSFDHSYNPEKALRAWMSTLSPGGICIIEYTDNHSVAKATELDPFGVEFEYLPYLVLNWSLGMFSVRKILHSSFVKEIGGEVRYLIIQNN